MPNPDCDSRARSDLKMPREEPRVKTLVPRQIHVNDPTAHVPARLGWHRKPDQPTRFSRILPVDLKPALHIPGRIGLAGNHTKSRTLKTRHWSAENHAVKDVERLETEVQAEPLLQFERFRQTHVLVQ